MEATPEFWTPQVLTEQELNDVCTWLFRIQSAIVTSNTLMADFDFEPPPMDPMLKKAMDNVQALIRHIRATREANSMTEEEEEWKHLALCIAEILDPILPEERAAVIKNLSLYYCPTCWSAKCKGGCNSLVVPEKA